MKFVKLRLAGFKSFVEASEFVIEPGLTGVVGPNGCGKSNLVEAMRWVMGESSYKAMRASGMDDVIFSGSNNRPARNTAEVSLTLDNADRSAPAAFNDTETIEVIRRIEREQGSLYRINGREVRARDVQLLFADASTGARSPALVRQGQIGELIAAKPQARRAILEEAAGISGLYSRRHEAELRLKGAEQNLDRLEDVLVEIDQQLESLKRQARQATRYRSISADIRKAEATLFHLRWTAARGAVREADAELATARRAVAERATAQGEAAKNEAVAALRMPELREAEARAAAALQRLTLARGELEAEEKRARARLAELAHRIAQLDEDIAREHRLAGENEGFLEALAAETATLVADTEAAGAREREAADRLGEATVRLQASEAALTEATREAAEVAARRDSLARAIRDAGARLARLEAEAANVAREAEALGILR
ncbi:MAG TPA: chromosome segregation SMC family protein, partial [Hyphomicrobiales bacterium]|nr:chromosome segregation SMC family protein [Hyphomicrobiales bacterium]